MVEDEELDARALDLDADLEPRSRPRSCTWPPPCPEDFPASAELNGAPCPLLKTEAELGPPCRAGRKSVNPGEVKREAGAAPLACLSGAALDVSGQLRKAKSSRRNAWGNLSYADLITRAIESTPDKRLTLSQIYDWMVRFVPYFKDKGDSNSSAGWKVRRTCTRTQIYRSASTKPLYETHTRYSSNSNLFLASISIVLLFVYLKETVL